MNLEVLVYAVLMCTSVCTAMCTFCFCNTKIATKKVSHSQTLTSESVMLVTVCSIKRYNNFISINQIYI